MVYGTTKKPTKRTTSGKGRWTTKPKPIPRPRKLPLKSEAMKAMRQRQAARAARGIGGQPGYGKPAKKTSWQKRNMMGPRKDRNQPGYEGKQAKPTNRLIGFRGQKPIPRRAPGGGKAGRMISRMRAMKQSPKGDTYKPKAPRQTTQYITGKTTGKPVQARRRTTTY